MSSSPLRLPAFRRVASAYTVNELGDAIGEVALAILVFDRTGSPLATAVLFLSLRVFPAVLAPLVTTRFEVLATGRILPLLYLGEGAIFAGIALLAHSFSLPAVLALAGLDGVLSITTKALIRSVNVGVLKPHGQLRQGNAIINIGMTTSSAIGPALAGLLVAGAGPAPALLLDAASFLGAAAILATAGNLRIESDHAAGTLGRLRAGLDEVWSRPSTRRLLLGAGAAMMFGTLVIPIEVVFVKRTLHGGDAGYGALIAAWGIGMAAGGWLFAAAGRVRLMVVISAGVGMIAAGYAGLAVSPDLVVACAFSVLGGIGNGVWVVSVVTALQESIRDSTQSAVMALLGSVYQVTPAIGFLLGGAVTAIGSPRTAYAVAAAGVAAVLVAMVARPVRTPELVPAQELR